MEARMLSGLKPGQSGVVESVGAQKPSTRRRLIEMGVTPMTEILVKKIAPLGDPIEVELRGYSLSLRLEDAQRIALMDPQEALARQAEAARALKVQSNAHATDAHAHRQAAELTHWVLSGCANGCRGCASGGSCQSCSACRPLGGRGRKHCPSPGIFPGGEDSAEHAPLKLALVGNPNAGKTTLFNAVTGAKEYVGNWPGVTVEKKERRFTAFGHEMTIVDLPGIYSLSAFSMEEVVSRNFVLDEHPDAVINIVDATNLERNLYLTVQLMELEKPMVIALNMMDELKRNGITIDCARMSELLGVPVVPICARTGEGVQELIGQCNRMLTAIHAQAHLGFHIEPDDLYDQATHQAHHAVGEAIGDAPKASGVPAHFAAIKLLEGDALMPDRLGLDDRQRARVERIVAAYSKAGGLSDNEMRVADSRYRYITRVCAQALTRRAPGEKTVSDRIDSVLTNKYLGIPIFLMVMGVIFALTFDTLGSFLSDGVDTLINTLLIPWIRGLLSGAPGWVASLVCDGVLTGVGGVLTFLPQIALLFFFLSLLEDSGYLSRTAFLMDRALKRFGLSGKSFIPMLMGFGCTVPAAMSARTMENEQDRRMTILLLPFMSCSAKLPVYGLIASIFFEHTRGLVVLSLYVLGILVGVATGVLFRKTAFKDNHAAFVLELPPYRLPSMRNTLLHVGERVGHFIEKAGTILLGMSVVLWFLMHFTSGLRFTDSAAQSLLGAFGSWIAPVFRPLGFGTWEASVALLTGLVAKEAVVSSLSLFTGSTGAALAGALQGLFTPLTAYCFLVFVLLYVPCLAAVATIRRELHSAKYTLFMVAYQIGVAYLMAFLVRLIGSALGIA